MTVSTDCTWIIPDRKTAGGGISCRDLLLKQPSEKRRYSIDYSEEMNDGETILLVLSLEHYNYSNPLPLSELTINNVVIDAVDAQKVEMDISDGVDGQKYTVRGLVLTTAQALMGICNLQVSDK